MNGKKAKHIRKLVYGDEYSPKHRGFYRLGNGSILAGEKRYIYQAMKGRRNV